MLTVKQIHSYPALSTVSGKRGAEMRISKAIELFILWVCQVARRLKKTDVKALNLCATLMRQGGEHAHALETYTKLGDFRSSYLDILPFLSAYNCEDVFYHFLVTGYVISVSKA